MAAPGAVKVFLLEDVREFFVRRQFLTGAWEHQSRPVVSAEEYVALKARTCELPAERAAYLRAFIDGWLRAKW